MIELMPESYPHLLDPLPLCAEKKQRYAYLTERHIQAIWLEQKYIYHLTTSQGEKIEVLSPGLWNTEAGPDFLKAHLRIGPIECKGDIEIHLDDDSWCTHRHHEDERYNQVILHLAYYLPMHPKSLFKQDGRTICQAYLEEALTTPISRLIHLIDLDLYPYKRFVGTGSCAKKLFKDLSEDKIKGLLTSAAYWRLEKKGDYLQSRLADRSLQLAGGIAMSLGYKHNAEAFLELFLFLLSYRDVSYQELLVIALGCCGFFEEGRKPSWERSIYYQQLRVLWWGWRQQLTHQACLRLDHIRPLNHPIRRLVYLVKLLQDPKLDALWLDMLRLWQAQVVHVQTIKDASQLARQLIDLIPNYEDDYWKHHFTFEISLQTRHLPLVGEGLKTEILVNTYLPLLYATIKERGEFEMWPAFQLFYQNLKSPASSKKRYLMRRFFGETNKQALFSRALMAQGAYQLHKDFCSHFEASCEGCPFVERYLSLHA